MEALQQCLEYLKSFEAEVNRLLARYTVRDGYKTATAVRGDKIRHFDILCSHGLKSEGGPVYYYRTREDAGENYLHTLKTYLQSQPGTRVHFRERPRIEEYSEGFFVYSRLFVADEWYENSVYVDPTENMANHPQYLEPGWRTNKKGPNPDNKSGFRATGHRILLIPEEVEKKTAGGLILPEKTVHAEEQRAVIATVLEIGPDAWRDKSTDYCELGDRVLIGQYVGKFHTSPIDGKVYRFVSDLDIISPLPKVE